MTIPPTPGISGGGSKTMSDLYWPVRQAAKEGAKELCSVPKGGSLCRYSNVHHSNQLIRCQARKILDFGEWASVYRTWIKRQAEYRNQFQLEQRNTPNLFELIRKAV